MLPQDVIRKKRDGLALSRHEIRSFIEGAIRGDVSERRIGAFTMAVYPLGMSSDETADLSLAIGDSGRVLDWAGLPASRIVDKHSSGGVGDEKITLLIVPLVRRLRPLRSKSFRPRIGLLRGRDRHARCRARLPDLADARPLHADRR